jgi:hypothetical protein
MSLSRGRGKGLDEPSCVFAIFSIFENGRKVFFENRGTWRDESIKSCVINTFPVPLVGGTRVGQESGKSRVTRV